MPGVPTSTRTGPASAELTAGVEPLPERRTGQVLELMREREAEQAPERMSAQGPPRARVVLPGFRRLDRRQLLEHFPLRLDRTRPG